MGNKGQVLNEAEVDFLLAASVATEESAAQTSAPRDAQTVTMRGDLEQINLADIFQTLAMSKMEGLLHVRNPIEERQVYCTNGTVRIRVPARLSIRRLGQRLVQAGLLDGEALRATLVLQRKEPLPLGELLVKQGLLTQDQIDEVAGMQVAEDLFALFTWRHGTFEFYKGELTDPAARAPIEKCPEFEVNSLLLEVARRSDEWEGILATIGSLDEVPRRTADPEPDAEFEAAERAILFSANGIATYRDLADQTTFPLFEAARAARTLVAAERLTNVDDEGMVAAATEQATMGQGKRALLLLQTLRDRPGTRSLAVVEAMSKALEKAGERRLAGTVLLEAAQQHADPEQALTLARRARDLAPNDAGTISFLRTTLLAHSEPDSEELEKCTLDLLDALIDADLTATALEIVADARNTGTMRPQILLREAKARQKARDTQGAVEVLMELAASYEAQNDKPRALETYDAVLRLDRSRKDVQKIVTQMRRTRAGRIARLTTMVAGTILLGGMGVVFWQQTAFEAATKEADAAVTALLDAGDRAGARRCWAEWHERLGDCEPVVDLLSRIDFADAAQKTKVEKAARKEINDALTAAAQLLEGGQIEAALKGYAVLLQRDSLREEVISVAGQRFEVLLGLLEQAAKAMVHGMPPEPSSLFDRRDLEQRCADLASICPPKLIHAFQELHRLNSDKALPEFLAEGMRARVDKLASESLPSFARAAELTAAYAEALQRNEHQRRLDPLFKAAVEREAANDFRGALDLYRTLESEPASDDQLRAHFRDQVARYTKICQMMDVVDNATRAGDFAEAQKGYRALRVAFEKVPFDRLVRLPIRIESRPAGGVITCNGKELGPAPMTLSYLPAEESRIRVSLDGFRAAEAIVTGDSRGAWIGHLVAEPTRSFVFDARVEVPPAVDRSGRLVFVDRAGVVRSIDASSGETRWEFRSGDLSGLLGRPHVWENLVLVTSLDGELRALDADRGEPAWTRPDYASDVAPAMVDKFLLVATTDRVLHAVDVAARAEIRAPLDDAAHDQVLAHGRIVIVGGDRGLVSAFVLPDLAPAWKTRLADVVQPGLAVGEGVVVAIDDAGHVHCIDLATGSVRWSKELDVETLGRPAIVQGAALVSTPDRIVRFDLATGAEREAIARLDDAWAGGPILIGGRIAVPVGNGSVQILDAERREFLFRLDGSGREGGLLTAAGRLFVVHADRRIAMFSALR